MIIVTNNNLLKVVNNEVLKMILKKELLMHLKDLGLNSYESKLWVALLSRGVSTAGELSDIANVPRSRTYDVLESLEKKGFIIMKIGKPIKYMSVPPEEVISRVKKREIEETQKKAEFLDKLKKSSLMDDLKFIYKKGINMVDVTELTGAIKGRNSIFNQMDTMIKSAEKEVIIHTTDAGTIRVLDYLGPTLQKVVKRGVKVKLAAPLNRETEKYLMRLPKNVEVRRSNLNARFIIADKKEILFTLMNDEKVHPSYDSGIWVNTPFFASAMADLFDLAWKDIPKVNIKARSLPIRR